MPDEKTPLTEDKNGLINKAIHPVVMPEKEIGIDTKDMFYRNLIQGAKTSTLDMGAIDSFTQISNSRDLVYNLLDTMAEDTTVAAVLETYSEDATEYNDEGRIVWVDASDSNVGTYVDFLLKTLNVDKNIYKWTHHLCKYGDLYLRLYRQSDYNDCIFETKEKKELTESFEDALLKEDLANSEGRQNKEKKPLDEAVYIKAYAKNDKYVRYLEMVPDPAQMFELTRFGKTAGYISAPNSVAKTATQSYDQIMQTSAYYRYSFKKNDINIYGPREFVHACLEDNTSRIPEEVQIFTSNSENPETEIGSTYTVKRGQSLLYTSYKAWRLKQLLENAILLSRLTRSSLVRVIQVEVGDMPKESVIPHMMNIKQLMEQKSAFTTDGAMNEYTNPGAVENCVYIPTHGGIGAITMQAIGGDYNVRDLADLDYYQDVFFGGLRIPKQYFGVTKDGAGFDGGKSLSIISSRYAKLVKRIQNTMVQMLTDAINLILLNDGLENYINKFHLRMLPPTTQEEIDRRENAKNKIDYVGSVMDLITEDAATDPFRLKILKSLLSSAITDTEVIDLIQAKINELEKKAKSDAEEEASDLAGGGGDEEGSDMGGGSDFGGSADMGGSEPSGMSSSTPLGLDDTSAPAEPASASEPSASGSDDHLPSGADLNIDLTDFA